MVAGFSVGVGVGKTVEEDIDFEIEEDEAVMFCLSSLLPRPENKAKRTRITKTRQPIGLLFFDFLCVMEYNPLIYNQKVPAYNLLRVSRVWLCNHCETYRQKKVRL